MDSTAIPIIYSFLPSKSIDTYIQLFEAVVNRMPANWSPLRIMSDFELSSLGAARQIFPQSIQSACNFHLGQSICKRINMLPNMRQLYQHNENVRTQLRTIQALAFVEPNVVYSYFLTTMTVIQGMVDAAEFRGAFFVLF